MVARQGIDGEILEVESMSVVFFEDEWRKPIQKMEIGDKVITKSRMISKAESELLVVLSGECLPQFLSQEAAQANGWKNQLVPGVVTLAIAYGLLMQAGFLRDVVAYLETKNMKFVAPVYPEDSIKVEAEVTEKSRTEKGWICSYHWIIWNLDGCIVAEGHNT